MRERLPLYLVLLLAFLGFADAAYLTAERYLTLPLPCSTGGCETVLTSAYSAIGPVPLSLLGVVYYLTVLFLAVQYFTSENPGLFLPRAILAITGLAFLASCVFVYEQVFLIRAICLYCVTSAAIAALLFFSGIWWNRLLREAQ